MAAPDMPRLRLSNRSVVSAVVALGLTLAAMRIFAASARVLGWMVVAAIMAALLHPLVARVDRRLPRGLALVTVVIATLAAIAGLVYLAVGDVSRQAARLERAAPEAAAEIEDSQRFGEAAREFELRQRVEDVVEQLPERLRGGDAATALRSAATRGVAYLATAVLTLFLLIHGVRIVEGALSQVRDPDRADRLRELLCRAYGRGSRYVALTLVRIVIAGFFTWGVCAYAGVPGARLLAIVTGVTALVPLIGVVLGSLPALMLAAAFSPERAPIAAGLFVAYQAAEVLLVQRRLERLSVHVGPVLTLVAAMVGLELYGLGGMVVSIVLVVFVAALGKELAPSDEDELLAAADIVLPGDEEKEQESS